MKKLIYGFLIASFLISGGVAFAGDYDESGAIRNTKLQHPGQASDPCKVVEFVRWADAGPNQPSLTSGDVVIWDLLSDDGVTISLVQALVANADIASSSDAVAGVCIGTIPTAETNIGGLSPAASEGRRNWGYIQIYGFNPNVKVDSSTISAGDGLKASGDPRRAKTVVRNTYSSQGNGGATLGFAYDATSATTDGVDVFIKTE